MADGLSSREMRLLKQFHVLEIAAGQLYRTGRRGLKDEELAKTLKEFEEVEVVHRDTLRGLIDKHGGKPIWYARFAGADAAALGSVVNLFGVRARLRFECWVERKAVKDYTKALEVVQDAEIRPLLAKYRDDEQHHIDTMTKLLERM